MVKVGIVGATGYTAVELLRILRRHHGAEVVSLMANECIGQKIDEIFPNLRGFYDLTVTELDTAAMAQAAEVVFTALPHGVSMDIVPQLLAAGLKVIDLGADYRFRDQAVYEAWYGPHSSPGLCRQAVYGLPELYRDQIKTAQLIGNPGCYPTSIILGMAPLLKAGLVTLDSIIADSKSGVSGAGKAPTAGSHFMTCDESFKAYKVAAHRHTPEIEQELSFLADAAVNISFTPHLVPMKRGILSTIYANLRETAQIEDLLEMYRKFYADEQFVRILPAGQLPDTKYVQGSNYCDIGLVVDKRVQRVIVVTAIDNLVKGASGQAVQNMNIMCGFMETKALRETPVWP